MDKIKVGFIGSGGIAKAHAYALQALNFYYADAPDIELRAVTSAIQSTRREFAEKYGFEKAFGMANLELDVPMKTEMVFEIGSITKQFTAVSILMLLEQGKFHLRLI